MFLIAVGLISLGIGNFSIASQVPGVLYLKEEISQEPFWQVGVNGFFQPDNSGKVSSGVDVVIEHSLGKRFGVGFLVQKFFSSSSEPKSSLANQLNDLEVKIRYLTPDSGLFAQGRYHLIFSRLRPSIDWNWDWGLDLLALGGLTFYPSGDSFETAGVGLETSLFGKSDFGVLLGARQFVEAPFRDSERMNRFQAHFGMGYRI